MTKEEQLSARPVVELPVNGGVLHVRRMGGASRLAYDNFLMGKSTDGKVDIATIRAAAYLSTVVNPDGSAMWTIEDAELIASEIPDDWQADVWTWAIENSGLGVKGKDAAVKN